MMKRGLLEDIENRIQVIGSTKPYQPMVIKKESEPYGLRLMKREGVGYGVRMMKRESPEGPLE